MYIISCSRETNSTTGIGISQLHAVLARVSSRYNKREMYKLLAIGVISSTISGQLDTGGGAHSRSLIIQNTHMSCLHTSTLTHTRAHPSFEPHTRHIYTQVHVYTLHHTRPLTYMPLGLLTHEIGATLPQLYDTYVIYVQEPTVVRSLMDILRLFVGSNESTMKPLALCLSHVLW